MFLFYCGCAAASAAAPRPDIYLTSLKTFCVLLCYEHDLHDQEQSIPRNGYLNLPCQLNTAEVYHFNKNWGGVKEKGKKKIKKNFCTLGGSATVLTDVPLPKLEQYVVLLNRESKKKIKQFHVFD